MKRILVTGEAGFLGSHLCNRLLKKGSHVICVDNLFTGSKDNIQTLIVNYCQHIIFQALILPMLCGAVWLLLLRG